MISNIPYSVQNPLIPKPTQVFKARDRRQNQTKWTQTFKEVKRQKEETLSPNIHIYDENGSGTLALRKNSVLFDVRV
ncbi:hypothetical protein [Halalkalibacter akibai]|uniref:Uncharacterized protein n=1 Tax=Halalkalibacter akibai (strain ATCC 43226 / DSM 21942 / CIP 109018 / JCM 9157 / 1139) TaxID=1236973 RepID=W4QRN2_HALA3|nr:hypothetical protein [Halalkalibacter akibai]GAE34756.1 hypothetical protein JCM9157_1833 [Halalkalibacter akibai JCM 9157]